MAAASTPPEMQEFYQSPREEKLNELAIVNRIKCEIHLAVQETLENYRKQPGYIGKNIQWITGWGSALRNLDDGRMSSLVEFLSPPTTVTEIIGGFVFDQNRKTASVSPKDFKQSRSCSRCRSLLHSSPPEHD